MSSLDERLGRLAASSLERLGRARAEPAAKARFDPVKTELELYDELYGRRTGTVENVAPVDEE